MKDYIFFSFGALFGRLSDWAFEKVSDDYLLFQEQRIDDEIDDRMSDLGMTKITIFHVNEGPIHRDSIPDDEDVPERCEWFLEVKCLVNDETDLSDTALWFADFNEAYAIVNHFYKSVEPKVIFV